jgi:hypothetical protein
MIACICAGVLETAYLLFGLTVFLVGLIWRK